MSMNNNQHQHHNTPSGVSQLIGTVEVGISGSDSQPVPNANHQAQPVVGMPNPLAQLHALEAELNIVLIERQEAIRAALVALIAGQNMVLLGPPGCGKSLIVTELARRIQDTSPAGSANSNLSSAITAAVAPTTGGGTGLKCFTLLMTKYTDPDEVFGPVSLAALKNDERRRTLTHKLPEAHFGFLDEVFKANSAVLNALLTVMNEREYDNGGPARLKLPLISLFGASNEMPEGRDLEAFWDRFLLRMVVNPVSDSGFDRLVKLLTGARPSPAAFLSLAQLNTLQLQARQTGFTPQVLQAYTRLRKELKARGIVPSDRRWGQCLELLQAHALLEGRQLVEEDDLAILSHALWNTPEQRTDIARLIGQLANPVAAKAVEYFDQASDIHQTALTAFRKAGDEDEKSRVIVEAVGKLKTLLQNTIVQCAPQHRAVLEGGGREGLKQVVAGLNAVSTGQSRTLNKIENIILQVSRMRDELVEHVS